MVVSSSKASLGIFHMKANTTLLQFNRLMRLDCHFLMDRIMFVEKERNVDDVVQHPQKQSKRKTVRKAVDIYRRNKIKPHKRLITLSPNAKHKQADLNKAQAQSPSE